MYESVGSMLSATEALNFYEKEHVNVKCADPARQRAAIVNLKAHFLDTPIKTIDIPASREYARRRREGEIGGGKRLKIKEAGDSTIRRELMVLVAAANHNVKWRRLLATEIPSVELPSETRHAAEFYTKDEVRYLIATAKGDLQKFLRILYWTGARRRAIEHLHARQVKFDSGHIDLLTPGKKQTVKRMPIVPIFPEIEQDLRELAPRGLLFGRDFYRQYHDHVDGAGFGSKAHPHVMRHSRATHLLQDGVSIYDVAKLLGDTVKTIEDRYGHHSAEHLLRSTGKGLGNE
jgi:integrase